ncbi:type II secretion system F family protein [Nevskia soli]|uniref:type II secretion system F family protein n=1 Tax=Nevskia soli TaxID=418856 RepID=UPI0004A723A7|nr:type II secretion system F family protein [Nevskia soli]
MSISLIVVVAVALAFLGVATWLFSMARGQERSEEVLTRLQAGTERPTTLSAGDSPEMAIPGVRWVSRLLWRGGSEIQPRGIVLVLLGLLVFLVLVFMVAGPVVGLPINIGTLLVIYLVLVQRAARRRSKIIEQLPGFLENMIRVMSAGNSLEEALVLAARESDDPLRPLFVSVGRQIKLGAPVDQVLAEAGGLYNLRDVKVLSLAASVNRRYGGSLRGVLKSLILAIRQRGTAARELRALTAETRFSAMVLAFVPVGLTTYIYLTNPQFYDAMWHDATGKKVLIGGVIWVVIGMIVLWRMVNSIGDDD